MAITRELIEARLAQLRAGLAQLRADIQATEGAIQDSEFWLAQLDAEPEPPEEAP